MKHAFTTRNPVAPFILGSGDGIDGPKTVMIVGIGRGGTSATTAVIDGLGLPSHTSTEGHYETLSFKESLQVNGNRQVVLDYIQGMNSKYKSWGVKTPLSISKIDWLSKTLRNPHLVMVFRDSVALVQTHCNRVVIKEQSEAMKQVLQWKRDMWEVALTNRIPTLLISFERLITTPVQVIPNIINFLKIEPTEEQIAEAYSRINPARGYLIPTKK